MTTIDQQTADRGGPGSIPAGSLPAGAVPAGAVRSGAAATTASSRRAYERRQRRTQKMSASRLVGPAGRRVSADQRSAALSKAPFAVLVIALLAAGIAGVLYLNTVTDEAGMRTSTARSTATDLRLTIESLRRDVAMLDATPHIADGAAALGMVPAGDSAMLMVDAAGAGTVVGDPSAVQAPAPPVDPAAAAAAAAGTPAGAATAASAPPSAPAPAPAPAAAPAPAPSAAAPAADPAPSAAAPATPPAPAAPPAPASAGPPAAEASTPAPASPADPVAQAPGVHQ